MHFKTSRYIIVSDLISGKEDEPAAKRIVFSTRKGMAVTVTNYLLSLIQSGQYGSIPDQMFNILMFHEIIIPADEDELHEITIRKSLTAHDQRTFENIISQQFDEEPDGVFSQKMNEEIRRATSSRDKTIKLDMAAPELRTLIKRINRVNDLLEETGCPEKIHVECTLSCFYSRDTEFGKLDFGILTVSDFHVLVDVRKRTLTKGDTASLKTFCSDRETADIKKHIHLIFADEQTGVVSEVSADLLAIHNQANVQLKTYLATQDGSAVLHDHLERKLLLNLSQAQLHLDLMSPLTCTYYRPNQQFNSPAFEPKEEFVVAKYLTGGNPITNSGNYFGKEKYNELIVDELTSKRTKCSVCVYLPMCGGRLHKSEVHDHDCPGFISNLVDKAKLKYRIPLQNN